MAARRTTIALLALAALVVLTLDVRETDGPIDRLQGRALSLFGPVVDGASQVARAVSGAAGAVTGVFDLAEENERLSREVASLREELGSQRDLERENAELRGLLSMRSRGDFDTVGARVIAEPSDDDPFSVLLDAGADDGLTPGMAVITEAGLAGKVTAVVPDYAEVELLASPGARYVVRVADTGDTGFLRGRGSDPFRLELLGPNARAPVGAGVVTRAFEGSTIPDGLRVGEVTEQQVLDSPRYRGVRPFADVADLGLVQVVTDAPSMPTDLNPSELLIDPSPPEPPSPPPSQPPRPEPSPSASRAPAPEPTVSAARAS